MPAFRHRLSALAPAAGALLLLAGCPDDKSVAPKPELSCGSSANWPQWALEPAHSGITCAQGQDLQRSIARVQIDENVEQEKAETQGDVLVHYQAPLVIDDDVYLEHKAGQYQACQPPGSGAAGCGAQAWQQQVWSERGMHWAGADLVQTFEFISDFKVPPNGFTMGGWEPVFHAAAAGALLYVPGAGGTLHQLDRLTGLHLRQVDPFGAPSPDPNQYLTGPVVVDAQGNAFYNLVKLDADDPWNAKGGADAQGFLVKVTPQGQASTVAYGNLVPQAPKPADTCEVGFANNVPRPLPPADVNGQPVPAPRARCGAMRAPVNTPPAVAADGTVYVVLRAHRTERDSFLVALKPDLTLKWAASLRGLLSDGCGVLLAADDDPKHCRAGALLGVDPGTNAPPAGRAADDSTSSPVVLPDGSVLYGTLSIYNGSRGHLLKFSEEGKPLGSYDFGWDITPAVFRHDGTYSIVLKDNHYNDGPFYITQLDANLKPEWKFQSSETRSCARNAAGALNCTDDHPGGFEWCVNSVAVDRSGVVYANSEDGNLYAIFPGGRLKQRLFLNLAIGAAYTPLSIDGKGRIYTQNDGAMYVVGQ